MNDLISRQDAIERMEKQMEHLRPDIDERDYIGYHAYLICKEFIERLPSARKKGKNISNNGFLCSVCSFGDFGGFHGYEPNFCPNCGADMRGEEDE